MMAMMLVASATTFAGVSDAFKALKKSFKGLAFAEAETLVKNSIDQLANAQEKAAAYRSVLDADTLVITADTVVVLGNEILGKPKDDDDARRMLHKLSGKTHQVITGVCLTTLSQQRRFAVTTDVTFKQFTDEEIDYYISKYHPMDKAGAYGIQEWIGHIGVTALNGSYFNVMGLPVQRIYTEMQKL